MIVSFRFGGKFISICNISRHGMPVLLFNQRSMSCGIPYTLLSQFGLPGNRNAHISIIGIAAHSIVSSAGSSATHRSQRHTNRNDFRRCSRREVRSVYCVKSKYAIQHSSPGRISRDAVNTIRPLLSGLWVIFTGSTLLLSNIEGPLTFGKHE